MKKYYAIFKSQYGYNSMVREGKIYFFSCKNMIYYLLQIHQDLINVWPIINRFFKHCFLMLYYKKHLPKMVMQQKHNVEIGLTTWAIQIKKIKTQYYQEKGRMELL